MPRSRVKLPLGDVKAIFFRDPDGYIVEAIQVPVPADAPAGNVVGVDHGPDGPPDMDESLSFWQAQLGLDLHRRPGRSPRRRRCWT